MKPMESRQGPKSGLMLTGSSDTEQARENNKRKKNSRRVPWFSNLNMHQDHWKAGYNRFMDPSIRFLTQ